VVAPPGDGVDEVIADRRAARDSFSAKGSLPTDDDPELPKPAGDWDGPVLAYRFDLGKIGSAPVSRHVVLAYDEGFSMQYLYRWLRPYWRRHGDTADLLLENALRDYESLNTRCQQFDED
jgi:hypothetical protein